jgi:PAS domain S-box-containing protein
MTAQLHESQARAGLLELQRRVLERIASGAPLAEVLEKLVELIERQATGMRCAVLLADAEQKQLRFIAAPSVPPEYKAGMEPLLRVGAGTGACGAAAFLRAPVYTKDMAIDPRWISCRDLAIRNGLRAIWSMPILSDENAVLGRFAMYYAEPRLPEPGHIQLIEMATQMARVAIDARRTEDALRESEHLLRRAMEAIPAMVWSARPDGTLDFLNGAWKQYMEVPAQELERWDWAARVHPEDRPRVLEHWRGLIANGIASEIEMRLRRSDGSYRWFFARQQPVRDEAGRITRWYGSLTDIEDRRQMEEKLRRSAEELQALSRRLVDLQESERKLLSRELHDRVGQNLTALGINLAMLQDRLPPATPEVDARLKDSAALVESTVRVIDNVAAELRPPMLDDFGLTSALAWYAKEFGARSGVAVSVEAQPGERLAPQIEIALFRIAQEALNNIAKHSRATRATIHVVRAGAACVMSIADNGIGSSEIQGPAQQRKPRLGMVTMRERAQAVGGTFEIASAPGSGTRLTVRVPA